MTKDLFGDALLDYYSGETSKELITWTSISDKDTLPVSYFFRSYDEMPLLEQTALKLSQGSVLDIGCGSGSHSLWLQNRGYEVTAIDISIGAVEVAKKRGLKNVHLKSFLQESGKFDTILLLMNGSGVFEEFSKLKPSLEHLKSLLNRNGQILLDSSDLIYMYQDDDGGTWMDLSKDYYGDLDYYVSSNGIDVQSMKWLYIDFKNLKQACLEVGLKCELLTEGNHFDYLAKISIA